MRATEPPVGYSAYLLRIWKTADGADPVCRASMEDVHSSERVGFGTLDELFDYLRAHAGGTQESGGET